MFSNIPAEKLPQISKSRAAYLKKLDITTVNDILNHFPRSYEDRGKLKSIIELTDGEKAFVKATVASPCSVSRIRKNLTVVKARVFDDSGFMTVTYFNQIYMADILTEGKELNFYGKAVRKQRIVEMTNPVTEPEEKFTGKIVPIYPLTKGITSKMFSGFVGSALSYLDSRTCETLPSYIKEKHKLCDILFAYENIHFPQNETALSIAKKRLVFEELLFLQLGLLGLRNLNEKNNGIVFSNFKIAEKLAEELPYELTNAQKRVIREIAIDIKSGKQLNRLVQGDVGSGKTIVACAALMMAAFDSYQGALMAPTEILATQHYESMSPLFSKFGFTCALLTGSTTAKDKKQILEKLKLGEIDLLIGTHALIEKDVEFKNLALCVTDEQHRFGVGQRNKLFDKGVNPHILVMSATPIPRTTALLLYSDLELSVIDEMPPGRQKVETVIANEKQRSKINEFLKKEIKNKNRIYAVCPLIEESENSSPDLKSAVIYAEELKKAIPEARIAILHGKMKPKEKDEIMMAFKNGETDILVSTTVIEVGVNVPEATVMLIENAERFGLSQLHQLRGRVGRGNRKSYAILMSSSNSKQAKERLKILKDTSDGFVISEKDLEMRGPGDFFGKEQSGFTDTKIANLISDIRLLKEANEGAKSILKEDPRLSYEKNSLLKINVNKMFARDNHIFN